MRTPDGAARTLLRVIERNPQAVLEALEREIHSPDVRQ